VIVEFAEDARRRARSCSVLPQAFCNTADSVKSASTNALSREQGAVSKQTRGSTYVLSPFYVLFFTYCKQF